MQSLGCWRAWRVGFLARAAVWCGAAGAALSCADSESHPLAGGGLNEPCFPNGTCFASFQCVGGFCVEGDGGAADASSGGTAGGGGSTGGGSGNGGNAGSGGSSGSAGSGGSGGGSSCTPPSHDCGGTCVPNTPQTGCAKSTACDPCETPAHASPTCTAGGDCAFNCLTGYVKQGAECVPGGSGGSGGGGSGGSGGTGGSGGGCPGGGCPPTPTNAHGCGSCGGACDSPWTLTWDASPGADRYIVRYQCLFNFAMKDVGNVTSVDLCNTVGMCNDSACANGAGAVTVEACNASGCSAPATFPASETPLACGGGVCC